MSEYIESTSVCKSSSVPEFLITKSKNIFSKHLFQYTQKRNIFYEEIFLDNSFGGIDRRKKVIPLIIENIYSNKENPINNPNNVKVIVDNHSDAMYFSRLPIPYGSKKINDYNRHVGVYAFLKNALIEFSRLSVASGWIVIISAPASA